MIATPATPPTTPPAMAAVSDFFVVLGTGVEVLVEDPVVAPMGAPKLD